MPAVVAHENIGSFITKGDTYIVDITEAGIEVILDNGNHHTFVESFAFNWYFTPSWDKIHKYIDYKLNDNIKVL